MDRSQFLSKVIGIYLVIVSIAMLVNMPQFVGRVDSLIHNPALMFVSGFFALIVGILIVVSHNIWQLNWRTAITIVGWATLLKGACILICPQTISGMAMQFVLNPGIAYTAACLQFIIGVLLVFCATTKNKKSRGK